MSKVGRFIKQLLPTGRAWNLPKDGDKFIESNSERTQELFTDILSTLDSILPDNAGFSEYDATRWEQRLGMITTPGLDLATRKLAIARKLNYPGTIRARQSADYFQEQLRLAGFMDVYVHENPNNLSPENILLMNGTVFQIGDAQFGDGQFGNTYSYYNGLFKIAQFGDAQMGSVQFGEYVFNKIIANSIFSELDKYFHYSNNDRTFVLGGATFGSFGTIDASREQEFRQLILKLKPAKTVGLLFINYV